LYWDLLLSSLEEIAVGSRAEVKEAGDQGALPNSPYELIFFLFFFLLLTKLLILQLIDGINNLLFL